MSGRDLVSDMREGGKTPPTPGRSGILDLLLTIVVIAAIGSVGYFGVMYWLSSGGPKPAVPPPGMTAAAVSFPDVSWTEADAALCRSKGRTAANAPVPVEFSLANPAVTEGFAGLATAIDCTLSTKVARFCDPAQKAAMVAMINDYLGRVDLVQMGLGVQGRADGDHG